MRSFLIKVSLFLLPLLALRTGAEVAFRSVPNLYSEKSRCLQEAAPRLTGVVLGNSHAYRGIDPALLPGEALNLASVSQSLRYDAAILDRTLELNPGLRYVVLAVSDFSIGYELHRSPSSWRCDFYRAMWGFDQAPVPVHQRNYLLTQHVGLGRAVPLMWRWWRRGASPVRQDARGFAALPERREPAPATEVAERHLAVYLRENEILNRGFLRTMAERTAEQGATLILVTLPVTRPYLDLLAEAGLPARTRALSEELRDAHLNVRLLDLGDLPLEATHFGDADHLSRSGARLVSEALAAYLRDAGLAD